MSSSSDSVLAGLARVVRVADETRWRGQSSVAACVVLVAFWALNWVLGVPVERVRTPVGFAAVFVATLPLVLFSSRRRVRETLAQARGLPRSVVHETAAASRERRMRLVSVVLFGVIVLLVFDHLTGGGGMMAGLIAGLLGGMGISDWRESALWRAAERERDVRLFAIVRPRALTPALAPQDVFQVPNGSVGGPLELPVDRADLV